jgi:hypothetical protein
VLDEKLKPGGLTSGTWSGCLGHDTIGQDLMDDIQPDTLRQFAWAQVASCGLLRTFTLLWSPGGPWKRAPKTPSSTRPHPTRVWCTNDTRVPSKYTDMSMVVRSLSADSAPASRPFFDFLR